MPQKVCKVSNSKAFFALLKTQLKVQFNLSALRYKIFKNKRTLMQTLFAVLIMLFLLFLFFGFFSTAFNVVTKAGFMVGQPELVLAVALLLAQLFELVTGIFTMTSTFYYAKDLPMLITMPFKPWQIIASKFLVALITEYLVALPILVTGMGLYAQYVHVGAVYWIYAVLITIAAPVLPLAIASLIVLVLMRFINLTKSRTLFSVLGSIVGVAIGIGIQIFAQRLNSFDIIQNTSLEQVNLIKTVSSAFPPASWGANALMFSNMTGFLYLLLFLGVSFAALACMLAISQGTFYKAALASMESTAPRKRLTSDQIYKAASKTRNHTMALFSKEWKLFWRTPLFLSNALSPFIIFFIAVFLPMITSSSGGQSVNDLSQLLNVPNGGLIMNLILAGILLMSIAMNSVSYTAFSREGRTYWMSLSIPVKRREQVNAKLINCLAIETVFATLITVAFSLLFRRSLSDILTVIALLVPAMIPPICVNMALDALMPKLDWVTPQQLFKRGIFTILFFLLSLIPVGIMGATAVFLLNKQVSANLIYVSIICLSVAIAAATYELLLMASKNFYKLPE